MAVCAVGILALPALAPAALTFENTRVDLKAEPEDEKIAARFKFSNQSDETVIVQEVHSNCGCISAKTDKSSYAPGESGAVEAVFKVGGIEGKTEKLVTLQTSAKDMPLQQLTVGIEVPSVFEIGPDLTQWLVGEEPVTKSVTFKVLTEDPVHIVEVTASRAGFASEVRTIEEGREYAIDITPQSTDAVKLGVLRIVTDCAIEKHRRTMAFYGVVKEIRQD
ncbi:hypothetical protein BH23VER1_BH23VER1_34540 [soil metagenome]